MRRSKMSRSGSRRLFTNTAKTAHPKNSQAAPIRGGIRL